jgi:hypothetical protein
MQSSVRDGKKTEGHVALAGFVFHADTPMVTGEGKTA